MTDSAGPASRAVAPGSVVLWLYGALGFMTLSHEVAWTRQLIGMVGSGMGAVAIMLAVFMAGLAIGSWLGGRAAERTASATRLLSTLFVMAGAGALLSMPLDRVVSIVSVGQRFPALGPEGSVLLTLAATVPVMMLPALFAGAAFPVVAGLASSRGGLLGGIGRALAAQTAGSVAGALVAGFVLLPRLGVDATFVVGAAIGILGGLALVYVRVPDVPATAPARQAASPVDTTPLMRASRLALALSGAATLVYEVAWTRELLLVFGSSVYATAVMLAAVLLGLGLGQWWGSRQRASVPGGLVSVARLLFAAAVFGALSVVLTRVAPVIYAYAFMSLRGSLLVFGLVQLLLSCLVVIVPATLIGIASPLLIRFAVASAEDRSRETGLAYAVNTFGAVAGSLVAGFVLVPLLSAKGAVAVAALCQLAAAGVLSVVAVRAGARRPMPALAFAVLLAAAAAYVSVDSASPLLNLTLTRPTTATAANVVAAARQAKAVYFRDAAQGRVAVYELPNSQRVLRGAGMVEGALGLIDAQTTELLVRLPAAVASSAKHYFVIGLGTGSTTFTALQVPGVEKVDTVELNPAMVEASRFFIEDRLSSDPRARIHTYDARVYLGAVEESYDVIVSEPSYPLSPYSAQLFTREFFELQRMRLNEGGVAVQWLPAYLLQPEDAAMMIKTFASVFPETHVWSTYVGQGQTVDLILIGVNGKAKVDPAAIESAIKKSGGEPFNFTYELDPQGVKAFLNDATVPMNTDDKPLLEYRTPLRQIDALWK